MLFYASNAVKGVVINMKIKWGVIGCGGIADRRTIPGMMLAENAELVAVMDTNFELAKAVKEKYGAQQAFDNIDDLLSLNEIQAVYIATPVFCHKEQVEKAAKKGKHILLEKPLGIDIQESKQIVQICKDANVKLGVGFMMRFHSCHKMMKEVVASGGIGEIVSASAKFTCWYPEMANAWRQKKSLSGGGAMMDMAIHCVDLIRYITNLEVTEVVAMNSNTIFNYEVEDSGCLIMRLKNGALCSVEANFNIPDDAAVCRLEICGSGGSMSAGGTIGQEDTGSVKIRRCSAENYDASQQRKDALAEVVNGKNGNMYKDEIESFGNSILNNTEYFLCGEDALLSQMVIEAAYKSDGEKSVTI